MEEDKLAEARDRLSRITEASRRIALTLDGEDRGVIIGGILSYTMAILDQTDPATRAAFMACMGAVATDLSYGTWDPITHPATFTKAMILSGK